MNIYLCFLVCLLFPIGRYHHCGVSELSLLSMCIDTPESTTNSLASGDFEVGAGVALASIGEYNVVLSAFLSL